jgi:ANTAR domain/GAF domain
VTGQRRKRLWQSIADHTVTPDHYGWAEAVCTVCVAALVSVEAAALTLRAKPRAQEMLAASDEWSARLEETQYTIGEGPGIQAYVDGAPVLVDDLRAEQARWPVFAEAALGMDATAAFAFPLQVGAIRIGTLNMYRHRPGRLSHDDLTDSALLADLATIALLKHTDTTENSPPDWMRPIGSYQDINIATGMLAARLGISLDDAFARLRGRSYAESRSVLDVARDVVERRIGFEHFPEY